ncbi:hypothetical protein DEO72_LG2g4321 [Vigna unguiculata]|uniref:Uncharacterized protein n=1 Tax=Vigna unguiculata TaxID=3917 RepID=A0A4D6L611_VIGUN|nr:hypothetical protein DEO72_LG2g4321 [Vigna unguiculata]
MGTPSRYKDMGMDELSVGDEEVVEILMKFVDQLPTKGLVRVYHLVHAIIDIEDGSTKFAFSLMGTPSRYKDMGMDELSVGDEEVVEILMKFVDQLPTKGLVRVYHLVHAIIDIEDGSTKFAFSLMGTPSRYKDMGMDELSVGDEEVVEILMKFVDQLPTKGLVRVYHLVHAIIDIEGLGYSGTGAYKEAVAILKLKGTYRPRFSQKSVPNAALGLGS